MAMCCCALGLPPAYFSVQIDRSSRLNNFRRRPTDQTLTTLSDAMANMLNNNNAKDDLAYARALLREGKVPSFKDMARGRRTPFIALPTIRAELWQI